jgi:hypothetical protein
MRIIGCNYSDTEDQLAVSVRLQDGDSPLNVTVWMDISGQEFNFWFSREPDTPVSTISLMHKLLVALDKETKQEDEIPFVDAARRLAAKQHDLDLPFLRSQDRLKEEIDGMLVNEGYANTFTALRDVVADHTVDQDETIRDAIVPVLDSIIAIIPEED